MRSRICSFVALLFAVLLFTVSMSVYGQKVNLSSIIESNRINRYSESLDDYPIFKSYSDMLDDVANRTYRSEYLGLAFKASAPPSKNSVTLEGTIVSDFDSPSVNFGAFGVNAPLLFDGRVECGFNSNQLGCNKVTHGDYVVVYGHLESYLSCRHDGTDVAVIANLIYKRLPNGYWMLVTI